MSSISSVGGFSAYPSNVQDIKNKNQAEEVNAKKQSEENVNVEKIQERKDNKSPVKAENGAMNGIDEYLKSIEEKTTKKLSGATPEAGTQTVSDKVKEYVKENNSEKLEKESEKAMTYNSKAAMELNGNQPNKEAVNEEKAIQENRIKQANESYKNVVQKQQQEENAQKSFAVMA